MIYKRLFVTAIAALIITVSCVSEQGKAPEMWPTEEWATSTPEMQGMSSAGLSEMIDEISDKNLFIDSIHIVRNGYLVFDAYRYPYSPRYNHIVHSCTKSIVSALIGIALDKGLIGGVGASVYDIFPDVKLENEPEYDLALTRLLTMSY